jgi:hypothetical protein
MADKITVTREVTPIGEDGRCLPPDPSLSYTQEISRSEKDGVTVIHKIVDSRKEVADRGK